jgi:hypothetical protein
MAEAGIGLGGLGLGGGGAALFGGASADSEAAADASPTTVQTAAGDGNMKVLLELIGAGVSVNNQDGTGYTAL